MYSSLLAPRGDDYPPTAIHTGFWTMSQPSTDPNTGLPEGVSKELYDFVQPRHGGDKEKPLYVGFGR